MTTTPPPSPTKIHFRDIEYCIFDSYNVTNPLITFPVEMLNSTEIPKFIVLIFHIEEHVFGTKNVKLVSIE